MIRGAILDVDGTVVRGREPVAGAPAGVHSLRAAGVDLLFCSNNPTKGAPAYVDRLSAAGIDATASAVLTAADSTVAYLREHHAGDDLYVLGEAGLVEILEAAGLSVVTDPENAGVGVDAGVVSIDRSFDYDDLATALWALGDDVPYVGTDPDRVIPAPERLVPGSGAVINAVAGVLEREPDAVLGKPSATARRLALDRLGTEPAETLVVGDRLDTDIALGAAAGMPTALVLTGVTTRSDLADSPYEPDYVLESLAEVDRVLAAETDG